MTLEEFEQIQPHLAGYLRARLGIYRPGYPCRDDGNCIVEGVYQGDDGRWEAHVIEGPDWETSVYFEARCHPSCQRGPGGPHVWTWADHRCCEKCKVDGAHHYQSVHE